MTQLIDLKQKVLRLLSDEDGTVYSDDLITDGISEAHIAVLPWSYKRAVHTFEGDESLTEFDLPDGFFKVISVFDVDIGYYVPEATQAAFTIPADNVDVNQEYQLFPEGSITFANAPVSSVIMNYGKYWTVPTSDTGTLEVPPMLHGPITLYAASYALLEKSSNVASIRQWADKNVDAGSPVMNPMRDQSSYYLERFVQIMKMLPALAQGSIS